MKIATAEEALASLVKLSLIDQTRLMQYLTARDSSLCGEMFFVDWVNGLEAKYGKDALGEVINEMQKEQTNDNVSQE